jgi:hypothetical protein
MPASLHLPLPSGSNITELIGNSNLCSANETEFTATGCSQVVAGTNYKVQGAALLIAARPLHLNQRPALAGQWLQLQWWSAVQHSMLQRVMPRTAVLRHLPCSLRLNACLVRWLAGP